MPLSSPAFKDSQTPEFLGRHATTTPTSPPAEFPTRLHSAGSVSSAAPGPSASDVNPPSPKASPGRDESQQFDDDSYVSVWAPFARVAIGLCIIIAGLVWSLHFDANASGVVYVATMLAYLIVMIAGGGLMVSGAATLWTRLTSTNSDEK